MKAAKSGPEPVREDCLIETPDDWHPNFNGDGEPDENGRHVRLSLLEFLDRSGWRACVWGADDDGAERDFAASERGLAQEVFNLIRGCGPISHADLLAVGFVNA